jgi:hypothetical protein
MAQYAQISAGVVANIIVLDDPSILNLFFANPITGGTYDYVIQIDQLNPVPQIGWTYQPPVYPNPQVFTNPNIADDGD